MKRNVEMQLLQMLPNELFLPAINHGNFSNAEIGIIGEELIKRFPDDTALEQKCRELFG